MRAGIVCRRQQVQLAAVILGIDRQESRYLKWCRAIIIADDRNAVSKGASPHAMGPVSSVNAP
jgi:hypothetical protein